MLVRRFVNAAFRLLLRDGWAEFAVREYNSMLTQTGGPLCPDDIRVPASLAFHISDVYLEELDKALAAPSPAPVPLTIILSPFFTLAARAQTKTTYNHIQETIFDPLLAALKVPQPKDPNSKRPRLKASYTNLVSNLCVSHMKEGAVVDAAKVRKALLRRMFEVASEEGTRDSNRRKMYALFTTAREDEDDGGSDN